MVVTLLGEDADRQTPTVEVLQEWAASNGISHPVVADAGFQVSYRYQFGGYPATHLLAPGMDIVAVDAHIAKTDVEALLPN